MTNLFEHHKYIKPFVRWAGGKKQLLPFLMEYVPSDFNNYLEPFVGGGSLLFKLKPTNVIIGDVNVELINAYEIIRGGDTLSLLKNELRQYENDKDFYYAMRTLDPFSLDLIKRAARFIYLNKTCFNGLYRVSKKGFNVPFGHRKSVKICDDKVLDSVHVFLSHTNLKIVCQDYKKTLRLARAGDFVYLDSPYAKVKESSFTKYYESDFSEQDQKELADEFKRLDKLGCKVLASNADTELMHYLYFDYDRISTKAHRFINSKGSGRKKAANELLIKNY